MNSVIVDTNAFLRFILNDIPNQKKQFEKILLKAKKSEIILLVPQIIIFEIDFVLEKYYKFSKEEVADKLQVIVDMPYFKIQDRDILRNTLVLYSQNNLSLVDCFLCAKAKEEGIELFTFDKNLQKILKRI